MLEEALTRGWDNFIGRRDGPMSFRFLVQPAVAIFFAVRAGLMDARQNKPPFLWAWLSNPSTRRERSRQVWTDVGTVFVAALNLDAIYQVFVHAGIFTFELLFTATVLAVVPYVVSRGLVTRVATWAGVGRQVVAPTEDDEQTEK
ncbi:hypothetical protein [Planctomicrobium piriforme]|uniref:Uncharacterized protein n=1 Tax=Planctomicrobium piriforme TaxID=1576369 RepID=A0A1I3SMY9_9PLAN|nr:hypothetical protein [Planctomicrobium piriforme]SFJ58951.1 hypothetical protein SAMN05421753_12460 [Planctomicrobium piriforme]